MCSDVSDRQIRFPVTGHALSNVTVTKPELATFRIRLLNVTLT